MVRRCNYRVPDIRHSRHHRGINPQSMSNVNHDGQSSKHLTKVTLQLNEPEFEVETLWAEPVAEGLFRLRNVPFLAYGFSEQDVVTVSEVDDRLMVTGVAERGRHSTSRIFLKQSADEEQFRPMWSRSQLLAVHTSGLIAGLSASTFRRVQTFMPSMTSFKVGKPLTYGSSKKATAAIRSESDIPVAVQMFLSHLTPERRAIRQLAWRPVTVALSAPSTGLPTTQALNISRNGRVLRPLAACRKLSLSASDVLPYRVSFDGFGKPGHRTLL